MSELCERYNAQVEERPQASVPIEEMRVSSRTHITSTLELNDLVVQSHAEISRCTIDRADIDILQVHTVHASNIHTPDGPIRGINQITSADAWNILRMIPPDEIRRYLGL